MLVTRKHSRGVKHGRTVDKDGTVRYFKEGVPHRIGAPAVIPVLGIAEYWVNGKAIAQ